MAKRKRQSTHEDDKDAGSNLAVSSKRSGNRIPIQAHVLPWLDHCLATGEVFRQTAPDYMKRITTQSFTWSSLDQKLRSIVKSHNKHPPYTPIILEKGSSCLQNFEGTQLQVQVTEIRSTLVSRSSEILGGVGPKPGIKIVLSSNSTTSHRALTASGETENLATAPSASSSRAAVCLDSESPPSSPSAPPQPNIPSKTNALEDPQPYFELNDGLSKETAAHQTGGSSRETTGAANDNELVLFQGPQGHRSPDGDETPSPCSSGLSPSPSGMTPVSASVLVNVFENGDLGLLSDSCYLLAKYRETVLQRDGAKSLGRLDRLVHESVGEDPLVQSQLQTAAKSLAEGLEKALSAVYQLHVHQSDESSTQARHDAMSPTASMFQKIFSSSLSLKALLLQTGQRYRADFVPTGARFNPDTMSLIGLESMEFWYRSQGLAGRGPKAPEPSHVVRFCVFPAIHAYSRGTEWSPEVDASAFTVDYCNFVGVEASTEGTSLDSVGRLISPFSATTTVETDALDKYSEGPPTLVFGRSW
ncbi:hypothetical protein PG993_012459 [Apiospora rasikravindrae]|uniref:Uncharacterized protein n=1 Tax=Apiospora rasikravindrae TaxID=990691 RepID=A0ABR1S2M3_9PEZI